MAIDSKHPLYQKHLPDWVMCRDSYDGERAVKDKGIAYLPPTSGQELDGMQPNAIGYKAYLSYKARAVFPDFMQTAVETLIGLMWQNPPTIELPKQMEPMLEKATTKGESLLQLLRRINEQQLVTGRVGLLADLPPTPDPVNPIPYIALYKTEDIINWDGGTREEVLTDSLNLVVLCESGEERDSKFQWVYKEKYRVLILGDAEANEATGVYKVGVFDGKTEFNEESLVEPSIRGTTLKKIPFTFINSKDIIENPDNPPLLGLVRLCMTIYRTEADYRQSLFMQGQDTLVVLGATEEDSHRVGAGAALNLPIGGDAKFIGVSSNGLSEQRLAIENDKKQAATKSGQLVDTSSKSKESGDALKTRMAAQTATLNQIAQSGAEGLQTILRTIAEWMNINPDEVKVTPNLDFINDEMLGKDLVDIMTAKTMGAPIALETIHELMQDRSLTELSFEDEMDKIADEVPIMGNTATDLNSNQDPNNNGA